LSLACWVCEYDSEGAIAITIARTNPLVRIVLLQTGHGPTLAA
jgi:hypothetical protein